MNTKKQQNGFQCIHCDKVITINKYMGTAHRNHCPFCLWSKHVDEKKPGDRRSDCRGAMKPIGLTFKHEGVDKYGKQKQGELMLVHSCQTCGKININRISGDDDEKNILSILNQTDISKEALASLNALDIDLLGKQNKGQVRRQLFGIEHA